jgi:prepilin-type processing-associated H-X9-DG protein
MLQLAIALDDDARAVRWRYSSEVQYPELDAYAQIGAARFKQFGAGIPPDGTFTLRLAFGLVKGYREDDSTHPFCTTLGSACERAERQGQRPPFVLPRRWLNNKDKLDLKTPFNFVSTADTIGGNSGSPVLDRAGELVGINFDRNRHGLVRNYVYTDGHARHIAVHSLAVLQVLENLYEAQPLVYELLGGKRDPTKNPRNTSSGSARAR